jgi:hypothetical protein
MFYVQNFYLLSPLHYYPNFVLDSLVDFVVEIGVVDIHVVVDIDVVVDFDAVVYLKLYFFLFF